MTQKNLSRHMRRIFLIAVYILTLTNMRRGTKRSEEGREPRRNDLDYRPFGDIIRMLVTCVISTILGSPAFRFLDE